MTASATSGTRSKTSGRMSGQCQSGAQAISLLLITFYVRRRAGSQEMNRTALAV